MVLNIELIGLFGGLNLRRKGVVLISGIISGIIFTFQKTATLGPISNSSEILQNGDSHVAKNVS